MELFEDIESIIGLLAFIGLAVLSRTAESWQKKRNRSPKSTPQEAWPEQPAHRTSPAPQPASGTLRPDTSSATHERNETHAAQRNRKHPKGQTMRSTNVPAAAEQAARNIPATKYRANERVAASPDPSNDPTGEHPSTEQREAFDLRRAILYSEILKPRYDVYE